RRHWDNFLLDKTRPDWNENTHITSVYGGQFKNRRDMDWLNLAWGLDFAHDKITSTSLSCHSREREAFFLELGRIWEEKYIFNLGLREDYYSDWVGEFSPNLDLGYIVTQDLKLRYSLGRSFRVPSYTELYYRDAGNIGDANLICEHNLSWEIGLDKKQNFGLLGLTFFQRRTEDTIDWVRENNSQPWQAKNSGRILFEGIEFDCCPQNRENAVFSLSRFGYTYIESNRKSDSVASLSKYALDYLRHQFTLGIRNILPFDFIQNWNLSYKERVNSGKWFLLDSRISKAIFKNRVKYEIFLEGTNLTNANYKEITDVAMPGRWLAFGVRTEF
ncbi:MAG: TonB-dependent receptor, partial [Candidatus Omnitrophica bacterium]|nr:TonB-dependent receptor [Candidatus Omnitrophota bacterium]